MPLHPITLDSKGSLAPQPGVPYPPSASMSPPLSPSCSSLSLGPSSPLQAVTTSVGPGGFVWSLRAASKVLPVWGWPLAPHFPRWTVSLYVPTLQAPVCQGVLEPGGWLPSPATHPRHALERHCWAISQRERLWRLGSPGQGTSGLVRGSSRVAWSPVHGRGCGLRTSQPLQPLPSPDVPSSARMSLPPPPDLQAQLKGHLLQPPFL